MALFVYSTPEVEEDARHHHVEDVLEDVKTRLETEQHIVGFQTFPYPYVRKRFNNFRLVASRHEVNEHVIIALLRIYVRGDNEYRDFLDDRDAYRDSVLAPLVSQSVLEELIAVRSREDEVTQLPLPNVEEQAFLYANINLSASGASDRLICESHAWVESFRTSTLLQTKLSSIWQELLKLAQDPVVGTGIQQLRVGSEIIAYRYFPNLNKLFLIAPLGQQPERAEQLLDPYRQLVDLDDDEVANEDIGKCTRRSYPELILADEDAWIQIQQNSDANLALSFEELRVLESAGTSTGHSDADVTGFPLFINGRAGSGKSTILQYLCAEYIANYLESAPRSFEPPAFFTYNAELLTQSKSVVASLLHHGHQHLIKSTTLDAEAIDRTIDRSFFEFHTYLHNLLPAEVQQSRFVPARRVTYPRFRELWEAKFGRTARARSEYGPDLSWHVVRTYIKGMSLEPGEPFDVDDYQVLPAKQKSVTPETFATIYDRVYRNWYRDLTREGYWDAQDLAHALIEHRCLDAKYPAIFCDEAQDYTALELEVLYRLNLFSKRTMRSYLSKRVPFVFAGDPFQTLNPTGFRWDAIKANFHLKLLDNLDPEATQRGDINYRELVFNYRSTQPIVRLCNTIQAIRMHLFDVPVSPQTTWGADGAAQHPLYFDLSDPNVQLHLQTHSDLTIIVPADEGEEASFVEADEVLRSFVKRDESNVPRNVLSSNRAKGLEFNRVVLYGFGAAAPAELIRQLEAPTALTPEQQLPLEYFINRLYVAASRPKRRLFIVDTEEALDNFWTYMIHQDKFDELVGRLKRKEEWHEHLGQLQHGFREAWSGDQDNPREIAERYEREGHARHDPFHLRQAAMQYDALGEILKAVECRARAFLYEQRYTEAAELYINHGYTQEAVRAYWQGHNWEALERLSISATSVSNSLEVRAANLLRETTPTFSAITIYLKDVEGLIDRSPTFLEEVTQDETWGQVLSDLATRALQSFDQEELSPKHAVPLVSRLRELLKRGVGVNLDTLATAYYKAAELKAAVEIWNDIEVPLQSAALYEAAKARLAPYPESLKALREDEQYQEIADLYESHPDVELQAEHINVVGEAYLKTGQPEKLQGLLGRSMTHEMSMALLAAILGEQVDPGVVSATARQAVAALVREQRWPLLESLIERSILPFANPVRPEQRAVNEYLKASRSDWYPHLLHTLARSSELVDTSNRVTSNLYRLLKPRLLDPQYLLQPNGLNVLEVGAIIERFGREKDALTFYERAEGLEGLDASLRREASLRWIAVRERLAEKDRSEGRTRNADRAMAESINRRKAINAVSIKLPRFPRLGNADVEMEAAGKPIDARVIDAQPVESMPKLSSDSVVREPDAQEALPEPLMIEVAGVEIRTFPKRRRIMLVESSSGDHLRIDAGAAPESVFEISQVSPTCIEVPSLNIQIEMGAPNIVRVIWPNSKVALDLPI